MIAFFILVAGIVCGVLVSRFGAKRGSGKFSRRLAGVVTGFVAIGVLSMMFMPPEPSAVAAAAASRKPAPKKPEITDRSLYAWVICKNAVLDQLRAPSTADFPWTPDMSRMAANDDKKYVIIGHVDAQNGYGATIRANWNCEATYKGDGYEVADDSSWITNVVMQSR